MKRILMLLIVCFLISIGLINAQNSKITGIVISEEDGLPVVGASVVVKGTSKGTITDMDGKFLIPDVPSSAKTLMVSFVGMRTVEIKVGQNLKVFLKSKSELIDEVVVTALGITRMEKTLGSSATIIKSEDIALSRNTNVINALSGKVAGLQVQAVSADPGAASSVVIRGFSSINGDNQPLYIVDGVPLQNSILNSQGHSMSLGGISNIASEDIESMTILKGAAATALYGSRASNGVIVITTKKADKGEGCNFTINYNGGIQARMISCLPEMQNDYGQGWNGVQTYIENASWGPKLDGSMQVYGPIWNNQQLIHKYSAVKDNVKEFFELGVSQNHTISLSGMSQDNRMTYYTSFSHTDDDGIMPSSVDSYKRNTLAFRTNYDAADWIKVSTSLNYAKTSTGVVGSFEGISVIDGLYEIPRDVSIRDMKDLNNPFNTPEAYFTPYGTTNPYWALANNKNHTNSKQIYGKFQLDVKPVDFLTFSYRLGFDYVDYDMKMGSPGIKLDDALIEEDYGYAPSNMNQAGWVYARYSRSHELNHDFLINFTKNYFEEKLDFDLNVGANINERANTSMYGQSDNLTFEKDFWDLSNGSVISKLVESQNKRRLVGLFGDLTLGWKDWLYLNITARNDWSSTLPINKNSFFYPGVTLSWIFSNHLFKDNDVLSFGKLRMAYGQTGSDASPYCTGMNFTQAYVEGYYTDTIVNFPMNGTNAFQISSVMGSSSLKPEVTSEFEVGINSQFFRSRLNMDIAYYHRITNNQIFALPVDPSSGYTSMITNFGKVRNQGIELLLNTTPIQTKNFRWDLNFNFAVNKNMVLSIPESLEGGKVTIDSFSAANDAVYMYAEVGKPIGTYYTYLPKFVEDKESPYYGCPIVDSYGMPVLSNEVQNTGKDMNHKWTGGISTAFSAYGFTLNASLDIRYGGHMFSRTKYLMQFTGNGIVTTYNDRRPFIIPNSVVINADGSYSENKTPIYQTDGSYQKYYNDYGYGYGGDSYMLDRTFIKLRNISLTWDLPKKHLRHFRGLSLTAFANNLFMWTARDNYYVDPESSTTGIDLAGMFGELYTNPSCRIFGFNLSLKF